MLCGDVILGLAGFYVGDCLSVLLLGGLNSVCLICLVIVMLGLCFLGDWYYTLDFFG